MGATTIDLAKLALIIQAITGLIVAVTALIALLINQKVANLPTRVDTAIVARALKEHTERVAQAIVEKNNGNS